MELKFKIKNKYNWHDWFAWYPIKLTDQSDNVYGEIIWLEKVERRMECDDFESNWWVYRIKN